jgi:hypothetical protein
MCSCRAVRRRRTSSGSSELLPTLAQVRQCRVSSWPLRKLLSSLAPPWSAVSCHKSALTSIRRRSRRLLTLVLQRLRRLWRLQPVHQPVFQLVFTLNTRLVLWLKWCPSLNPPLPFHASRNACFVIESPIAFQTILSTTVRSKFPLSTLLF